MNLAQAVLTALQMSCSPSTSMLQASPGLDQSLLEAQHASPAVPDGVLQKGAQAWIKADAWYFRSMARLQTLWEVRLCLSCSHATQPQNPYTAASSAVPLPLGVFASQASSAGWPAIRPVGGRLLLPSSCIVYALQRDIQPGISGAVS